MEEQPQFQEMPQEESGFKKQLTTVTPFSKYLALLLFIALPFIGGWVGYQYALQKIAIKEVEVESVQKEIFSTTEENDIITKGEFALDGSARYEELAGEPKEVLDLFIDRHVDPEYRDQNSYYLEYYDDNVALIYVAVPAGKSTNYVLYDRNTGELIEHDGCIDGWGGNIYTEEYMIGVSDFCGVSYYKRGATTIETIPDSRLPYVEQNRMTYTETIGMINTYQVSFDEATNILTVGLFVHEGGNKNRKIKDVYFNIP